MNRRFSNNQYIGSIRATFLIDFLPLSVNTLWIKFAGENSGFYYACVKEHKSSKTNTHTSSETFQKTEKANEKSDNTDNTSGRCSNHQGH